SGYNGLVGGSSPLGPTMIHLAFFLRSAVPANETTNAWFRFGSRPRMRSTPPSGGWRYGRVDGCPGVACTSNLVPKSATSEGAKVPGVPLAVFGATPWQ